MARLPLVLVAGIVKRYNRYLGPVPQVRPPVIEVRNSDIKEL